MNKKLFKELFAAKGLKMTDQRWTILRAVDESADHPDADQVLQRAQEIDPNVGIATVYRTLSAFADLDIIQAHDFGEGRNRYEIHKDHHHHLIDQDDGTVIEFSSEELENVIHEIAGSLGYDITDHRIELYGNKQNKG